MSAADLTAQPHRKQVRTQEAEQPARARYLVQSIKLEESGPSSMLVASIAVMSLLLFGAVIWAGATHVSEIAHTSGEIVPAGRVMNVRHLEGGVVQAVHASEGMHVHEGQALVTLVAADARAERDRLAARFANLRLEAERLRALVDGREPEFEPILADHRLLKADQMAIFQTQRESEESQARVLESRLEQRHAELASAQSRANSLRIEIALLAEEAEMRKILLDQGLQSRIVYLDTMRRLEGARGGLAETGENIARAKAQVAEAEGQLVELRSQLRTENLSQVGEVAVEIAEVSALFASAEERLERSVIRAGVDAVVKGMSVRRPGAVIAPGDPIAELVPTGVPLTVRAKMNTGDIGHVTVGDAVDLRISTYDFSRYGGIPGQVEQISATTFLAEDGEPYYEVEIALSKDYVGEDPAKNRVSPGMTVDAMIMTGEKSVLDYLMRPVYRGLSVAFSER